MTTPTTTIKNIKEITNYSIGTLMFPSDYHDSSSYYDLKQIKKKYGFHNRSKVYILTKVFDDDVDYINAKINKENKQKYATFCHEECEEARPSGMSGNWESDYPYGDVMIFGETTEEFEERKKQEEEIKRCKKVRKELMDKLKNLNEVKLSMMIDKIEDMLESIGE
jgi:hypothetical protein